MVAMDGSHVQKTLPVFLHATRDWQAMYNLENKAQSVFRALILLFALEGLLASGDLNRDNLFMVMGADIGFVSAQYRDQYQLGHL